MQEIIFIAVGAAVIGLLFAVYLTVSILREDEGNERVRFIGDAIRQGAAAFLKLEYTVLAVFVVVVVVILALFIDYDILGKIEGSEGGVPSTAVAYLIGAIGSALAGYIGMSIAVRANTRTTVKAQIGLNPALRLAFNSGAVMGLTVVGIGLLGVAILYWIFRDFQIVAGFGMGASVDRSVRQSGRGHLYEGGGRGRGPRGQGRGWNPRGRPAQPRYHRRQRGRQRG